MARKSKGRQKIEMTKMSKESNLLVTFSKRRSGLFKKASELCILCGAEIAIIVFSPGKKVFSFGHPNVESIINRYLTSPTENAATSCTSVASQLAEAHRSASVRELNLQLNDMVNLLEAEKKRGEELSRLRKEEQGGGGRWWEAPIAELRVEQLEQLKVAMEDLRKKVSLEVANVVNAAGGGGSWSVPPFLGVAPPESGGGDGGGLYADGNYVPSGGVGELCVTRHGFALGFGGRSFI